MMRTSTTLLLTAVLAACGAKPAPKTAPAEPLASPAAARSEAATEAPEPAEPERPGAPVSPAEPAKPDPKVELLAAETGAWETAKPVLQNHCASCHTKDGKKASKKKLDHLDIGSYPLGGHHTATIGFTIRDVLGLSAKRPTMPYGKPGSVKGDELAAIKAWTDAWEAAEKGGAHPEAEGHHH